MRFTLAGAFFSRRRHVAYSMADGLHWENALVSLKCSATTGENSREPVSSTDPNETTALAERAALPETRMFGIRIHRVDLRQSVETLLRWLDDSWPDCRYVVTPNVDHVVQLQERADLRAAYEHAALVTADGWPVVAASRLFGDRLPQRVPGSDLVPALFAAERPMTVFLLGAAPGVADRAAQRIEQQWPHVRVVGTCSPPMGFEQQEGESERIRHKINTCRPDVLIIGLGAPKQELWIHEHHQKLAVRVAICAGATIDFLAGHRKRAPRWMRRTGLEWLHRMLSEPRRLATRYFRDAVRFPPIVIREWRARRGRTM